MKKKLALAGVAALAVLSFTGCVGAAGGNNEGTATTTEVQAPIEAEKPATSSQALNVMKVDVQGLPGGIIAFDMLKDGITYACVTKSDSRSGVSCTHK